MKQIYNHDNIIIYNNDNLEILRELPDKSINLIYCDILYNTGKVFDDYSDNLGSPMEAVEWYRPRFQEMKRVLTANGSIFIHCNWRLDSYIRILMDEIFGGNCFRNRIYRKHSNERGFLFNFDPQVDIVMYYVKDPSNFVFNEECSGELYRAPLFENGYLESRDTPVTLQDSMEIQLSRKGKHWLITPSQIQQLLKKNEIVFINELPYRESNVIPQGNLWSEDEMLDPYDRTAVAEAYDTPKPEALLERIIKTCSNEGDSVADFFLGGGTTAVVAKKLNRAGIFCDISEKACRITVEKLNKLDNK